MALRKAIKTDYGVNAEYWNISFVQNNFIDKVLYVKLFGFSDAKARLESAMPLGVIEMRWADKEYLNDIDRKSLYELIKLSPEFENAEDI